MVKLIALRPHTLDGSRRYKTGDVYEVANETRAKLIVSHGLARRDMEAAPARAPAHHTAAIDTSPDLGEIESEGSKKSRYKRRDMTPEE